MKIEHGIVTLTFIAIFILDLKKFERVSHFQLEAMSFYFIFCQPNSWYAIIYDQDCRRMIRKKQKQ